MSLQSTLERAANEVERNRLWRAREILCSSIQNYGYEPDLFRSIADLMLLMGDELEAGKYYLLSVTEPDDAELAAIDCFLSRYRKSDFRNLIGLFPPQAQKSNVNEYPIFLQQYLKKLGAREQIELAKTKRFEPANKWIAAAFVIAFVTFIALAFLGLVTAIAILSGHFG